MLEQAVHELTERTAVLLGPVIATTGLASPQMLRAIATGAAVAAIVLAVLLVLNALDCIAVWVAARRVESLAARCDLPQRDRLARPFLYAFRHSTRLARWAASELYRISRDQANQTKQNGRLQDGTAPPLPPNFDDVSEPFGVAPSVIRTSTLFFTVTIIIGGISLVVAALIVIFAPKLVGSAGGPNAHLSKAIGLGMVASLSAAGIGLTGLISPIFLQPISAFARRNRDRLVRAVEDCASAAANVTLPLVKSRDLRTVREISQLRRLLDEDRRVRLEDSGRLTQAVNQMEEIGRLWRESNDVDGKGIIQAVRQLALGVANLHERIEASASHKASLQISDGDKASIAMVAETVDRFARSLSDLSDAQERMAKMVDALTAAAHAIERAAQSSASGIGPRPVESLQPAIAELSDLMKNEIAGAGQDSPPISSEEDGRARE